MSAGEHLNEQQFGKPLPPLSEEAKKHISATSAVRGGFRSPAGLGRMSHGEMLVMTNPKELFERLAPGSIPERHRKAPLN